MAYRNSVIKSIQTGSIAVSGIGVTSNTATISSVDPNNTELVWNGYTTSNPSTQRDFEAIRIDLTNATTITATRGAGSSTVITVYFTVVEYYPGLLKSAVQRGTITLSAFNSATAAISAVVAAKAVISCLGFSTTDGASQTQDFWDIGVNFSSTTLAHAFRTTADVGTTLVGYQVVEFK